MNVKVVLTKDLPNVGKAGDIIECKKGYAVNFIIPRGYGRIATKNDINNYQNSVKRKQEAETKKVKMLQDIKKFIEQRLVKKPVTIKVKTTTGGKVYGSVTHDELREALLRRIPQLSVFTDKELRFKFPDRIEQIGKYVFDLTVKAQQGGKTVEAVIPIFVDIVSISKAHLKSVTKD